MTPFFNHKGTTYSLADVQYITDIFTDREFRTSFEVHFGNGIEYLLITAQSYSQHRDDADFDINHRTKITNIHKELKRLWAEFKMSIPQIG